MLFQKRENFFSVKKTILILLGSILFFGLSFFLFEKIKIQKEIKMKIEKGLIFLQQNQLPNGEIKVFYCEEKEMKNCKFESSSVPTVFVLDALSFSSDKMAATISDKGRKFVQSQQAEDGLWRYWSKESEMWVAPDFDDTAVASRYLEANKIPFIPNKEKLEKNAEGLYYTWAAGLELMKKIEIDPGVNANILAYLKNNDKKVCAFVNEAIKKDNKKLFYYPDKQAFYYIVSKAYSNGATCLKESGEIVIEKTLAMKKNDGSFGNNLETALSIAALINYDYKKEEVLASGIKFLIDQQKENGSWEKQRMYVTGIMKPVAHFGSEELSTAISIEALEKFSKKL